MKKFLIYAVLMALCSTAAQAKDKAVKQAEFGDAWPFTVASGTVGCETGPSAVFKNNGKVYALNGTAKRLADRAGYLDIQPIWRIDPVLKAYPMTGKNGEKIYARVSISEMIDLALKHC